MASYCITDGTMIYSVGDTAEQAIADYRANGGSADAIREGYYRDGKLSLIEISGDLYDRVLMIGGNLTFEIEGHGRHSCAVIADDSADAEL